MSDTMGIKIKENIEIRGLKVPKQFMHVSFVLLLIMIFSVTPIVFALMPEISLEDLTKEADVIIIGDIKEVESRSNLWRTDVNTYSTVSVEKYIKGTGSEMLTIITEGGTAGDSSVWVEDIPIFTKDEKVLVFLKKDGGEFRVAGLVQGKYVIENDRVQDISGENVLFKDFLRRVEDAILPHDAMVAQAIPESPGFGIILSLTGLLVVSMRMGKK